MKGKEGGVGGLRGGGRYVLSSRGKLEEGGEKRGERAYSMSGLLSGEKSTDFD